MKSRRHVFDLMFRIHAPSVVSPVVRAYVHTPQADGRLPENQRRNYSSVFHALYRIAKDEGVLTYWRGGSTTGKFR